MNGVAAEESFIKADMTEFKNAVTVTQIWMSEAEGHISDMEDKVKSMAEDNSKCAKQLKQLWAHVDDQENRSSRKNIRLIGVKEDMERGGNN